MSRILFDLEADGLLHTVKHTWCLCMKDVDTEEKWSFGPREFNDGLSFMFERATVLMGHNVIGYDIPVIKKLHWLFEWPKKWPLIVDTLVISRALWPERPGGHALAAWGERLGYPKIEFDQWDKYTPEMLTYCEGDVELNHLVLKELEKEHGATFEGYKVY